MNSSAIKHLIILKEKSRFTQLTKFILYLILIGANILYNNKG